MKLSISPHEYVDHPHNTTIKNERAIELVLARRFLAEFNHPRVLEIGAVTPYYWASNHVVADPFDSHPRVNLKLRAEEIDYTGMDVLSISTIEHIGEEKSSAADGAFPVLLRIMQHSHNCLVTFPVGQNADLNKRVRDWQGLFRPLFYVKTATHDKPVWELRTDGFNHKYPSPIFGWAEAIVVLSKFAWRAS